MTEEEEKNINNEIMNILLSDEFTDPSLIISNMIDPFLHQIFLFLEEDPEQFERLYPVLFRWLMDQTPMTKSEIKDLFIRAIEEGHLPVVQFLVEQGANIHADDLRLAANQGHLDVVRYLVEQGGNIHAEHA